MKSVLIHLDEVTYRALNRVAPAAKRKRTEFIRRAVREAIRRQEFAHMKAAYAAHPDEPSVKDDWTNWEEFNA